MSTESSDIALDQFDCVRGIILRYAKAFTTQLMESVVCNSLHTAKQRIARWMMEANDRLAAKHSFPWSRPRRVHSKAGSVLPGNNSLLGNFGPKVRATISAVAAGVS